MTATLTALVTGAAGGIGRAVCRAFRSAGYFVVATDVRESDCGADAFVAVDLARLTREAPYREDMLGQVRGALPADGLTVLINNAAVQLLGEANQISEDAWHESMDVNVLAPLMLTQGFLPELRRARGSVINMASIHAELTKPGFVTYATSKAALVGLTRSLAVDLGGRIRVNAICPAAIKTPMLDAAFEHRPEAYSQLAAAHPAERIGVPEEVARCALFLANPDNAFLTGAILYLDGGVRSRLHDPL
jgi:NAD(P)-dependent dehydrogenase (short-subunit alcohol dehydrogenase family)